jgi:hypothetical protein
MTLRTIELVYSFTMDVFSDEKYVVVIGEAGVKFDYVGMIQSL